VRKNASGYALDHFLPAGSGVDLLVGSEGTLGFVTSVRLRLLPLPVECALLLLTLPDGATLAPAVRAADAADATACEFFARRFLDLSGLRQRTDLAAGLADAPALLLVELAGAAEEVEARVEVMRAFAQTLEAPVLEARSAEERARLWRIRHAASPVVAAAAESGRVSMQFVEDSVVHPDHLDAYLGGMEALLTLEETDAVMFGHAGDGNVHLNPLMDVRRRDWRARARRILEGTVELVSELGGTLSGEHGDGRIRAPFHERIFGPSFARAFRAVKEALDPRAILNPGVVVAEPGQDPLAGLSPEPRVGR
jgi:FAD/FMN-containing dehydrogenase